MIKQTWEISNEERNRILSLHESATKNHYLMSEQTDVEVWDLVYMNYILKKGDKYFARITPEDLIQIPTDLEISAVIQKKPNPSPNSKFTIVPTELTQNGIDVGRRMARSRPIGPIEQATTPIPFCYFDTEYNVPTYAAISLRGSFYLGSMVFPDQVEIKEREGNVVTFKKSYTKNFIIELRDIQAGTPGRVPEPEDTPPIETPKITSFDIESPFEFDKTDLTPEAEKSFKEFIENIKKFYSNVNGDVTVTTSASIDSDPATKEQYNMELSKRRAQEIIDRLKRETGNETLNFIPNPIGQTDQFAKGMKYPEVRDTNKTAPNRRLIIKLPEISVRK